MQCLLRDYDLQGQQTSRVTLSGPCERHVCLERLRGGLVHGSKGGVAFYIIRRSRNAVVVRSEDDVGAACDNVETK